MDWNKYDRQRAVRSRISLIVSVTAFIVSLLALVRQL